MQLSEHCNLSHHHTIVIADICSSELIAAWDIVVSLPLDFLMAHALFLVLQELADRHHVSDRQIMYL